MTQLLLPIIYLAFISLGLPDSLLGSAWPTMYPQLGVPFSYAGILSMIISLGTIVSSLNSDRLTRALGTGRVTALSVGMTAAALFGFSVSGQFWMLCLWAIPYGLGAGSVDAGGVHQHILHGALGDDAGNAAAGRLGLFGHNSDLFAHKVVRQAGFAHVGAAHQRHKDAGRHFRNRFCHSVVCLSLLSWKNGK